MVVRDLFDVITAAVGVSGIFFSGVTLWLLKRQANEMSRQVEAMKVQAETMGRQLAVADKTVVLQFRPRLIIRAGMFDRGGLHFQLSNIGGTSATIDHFKSTVILLTRDGDYPELDPVGEVPLEKQSLNPGQSFYIQATISREVQGEMKKYIAAAHQAFERGIVAPILWVGSLSYKDDIGIIRWVAIKRRFDPRTKRFVAESPGEFDYAD